MKNKIRISPTNKRNDISLTTFIIFSYSIERNLTPSFLVFLFSFFQPISLFFVLYHSRKKIERYFSANCQAAIHIILYIVSFILLRKTKKEITKCFLLLSLSSAFFIKFFGNLMNTITKKFLSFRL